MGMDFHDYVTVIVAFTLIIILSILKELNVPYRKAFMSLPRPARWVAWYLLIMTIVIFGAYGSGYDAAGMIYAKF